MGVGVGLGVDLGVGVDVSVGLDVDVGAVLIRVRSEELGSGPWVRG